MKNLSYMYMHIVAPKRAVFLSIEYVYLTSILFRICAFTQFYYYMYRYTWPMHVGGEYEMYMTLYT